MNDIGYVVLVLMKNGYYVGTAYAENARGAAELVKKDMRLRDIEMIEEIRATSFGLMQKVWVDD